MTRDELMQTLAGYTISVEYEASAPGAYMGRGWKHKSFPGDQFREAQNFANTHGATGCEIYDSHGHFSQKIFDGYWKMVRQVKSMDETRERG